VISTSAVDAYVEKHSRRFIEELKELCSFPSISNHGLEAVQPARDWIGQRLSRFTDRVETFDAGGMPALYAEVKGSGRRKLLLYQHYDVQPVDPVDLWSSPPFEPREKDGRIFARGVADDKADVMARIHALEALKDLGEVPVTLRFLVEGEEEIGSKTFEKIAHDHADKLRADGCLWESGSSFDDAGRPAIQFGCRGLLYVNLRALPRRRAGKPSRPRHERQDRRLLRPRRQADRGRSSDAREDRPRGREASRTCRLRQARARPEGGAGDRADAVPSDV
jgi:acetylornithine deacetylase/succinyl-diaminopimelate desuccinylase-like protein